MPQKRILIFTNHFYPENFRINDIAFELADKGCYVTVLTGIPNYPEGRFFPGYGYFSKTSEVFKNVQVVRVPLIPRGNGNGSRLVLNYFSYAAFLLIWAFFLCHLKKFDYILVHHTSPIFIGIPAIFAKKLYGCKLFFWNLDLWPESVSAAGNVNHKFILTSLDKLVRHIYRNSDKLLISSMGFRESCLQKGVEKNNIIYFPNWAEDVFLKSDNVFDPSKFNVPEEDYKILFAGNIGEAQDMESILQSILYLKQNNIEHISWLFAGSGRKLEWFKSEVLRHNLHSNVFFIGQYPLEEMPAVIRRADAMLVSLADKEIFSYTVPAKVQAYMASHKPILAMINGEGSRVIEEANCGLTCKAGDYEALAQNALRLSQMNMNEKKKMGENAFAYYQSHFKKEMILAKLWNLLQ